MDLPIGTVLLGKYRVDAVLGVGGMGAVVRASHLFLAQPVAIKVLLPAFAQDASTVQRFLREAQSAVQLRGEHIARVQDVGTLEDGRPFMVMEYLEGADLNQVLRAHGPQSSEICADLMLQACEGIAEAHAIGIVHRDIKPSNFFVTRMSDGEMLLKILDFGISKSTTELTELTGTQAVVGTPSYMAPEQMRTARLADARADQWSIGVVMYQLLTGRVPFEADTYAELVLKAAMDPPAPIHVQVPPGLGEIVFRCLEKNPDARFPNVAELARMLAPYSTDPMAGARSAERAMRILNVRTSGPSLFGANGELNALGGMTPNPLGPLSPRTWPTGPGTNPSSVSGGAGQISQLSHARRRTTPKRNLLPAMVIGGCLVLGIGGVLVHHAVSGGSSTPQLTSSPVVAPAAVPTAAAPAVAPTITIDAAVAVVPAVISPAVTPAVTPAVATDAAVAVAPVVAVDAAVAVAAAVVVDAAIAAAVPPIVADAGVVAPTPTPTRKPFSSPATPPTTPTTKPIAKPSTATPTTKPKHKRGDDLFDDRH